MLVELLAVGAGEDHLVVVAFSLQCGYTAVDGLALHHHSGKATIGIVIHAPPLVERVVAQVVQLDFCQSFLLCPSQDAFMHESLYHLGQHSDNIYSHLSFVSFCLQSYEFFWKQEPL